MVLFNDSIWYNIVYGDFNVIEDQIIVVVKVVCIYEFIIGLFDGYDIMVGECGFKLLGGEKQWVGIVWIILKDFVILLLDEVISVLDIEIECSIQVELKVMGQGWIVLMIVYWFLMIVDVDQIIVLEDGKIVECGMYEVLLD